MANDIKLQEGHPVDENLRPLKVGGKATAIEIAQHGNGARVSGDLEITGNTYAEIEKMYLGSDHLIPAYSGSIIAYTMIGETGVHDSYALTTSYAVPDSGMNVSFHAPPSGNVEIMIQVYCNVTTSGRSFYFGLSDNSTYNSIGGGYEQLAIFPDETDDTMHQHYWVITGLTAGSVYTYYLGAKISNTIGYLNWGGTASGRYCDFIMKATALPPDCSINAVTKFKYD